MVFILIAIAVGGAVATSGTGIFTFAVINAVASVWSNGVLANFRGGPPELAPDWAATVSMLTTVIGIGMIVAGLAM